MIFYFFLRENTFLKLQKQGLIKEIYANSGLRKDEGNVKRVISEIKETETKLEMKTLYKRKQKL